MRLQETLVSWQNMLQIRVGNTERHVGISIEDITYHILRIGITKTSNYSFDEDEKALHDENRALREEIIEWHLTTVRSYYRIVWCNSIISSTLVCHAGNQPKTLLLRESTPWSLPTNSDSTCRKNRTIWKDLDGGHGRRAHLLGFSKSSFWSRNKARYWPRNSCSTWYCINHGDFTETNSDGSVSENDGLQSLTISSYQNLKGL